MAKPSISKLIKDDITKRVESLSPEQLNEISEIYRDYHANMRNAARGVDDYLAELHDALWLRYTFVSSPRTFKQAQLLQLAKYFLEFVLSYDTELRSSAGLKSSYIYGSKDAGIQEIKASFTTIGISKVSLARDIGLTTVKKFYDMCEGSKVTTGFFFAIGKFSSESRNFLKTQQRDLYSGQNVVLLSGRDMVAISSLLSRTCDILLEIHSIEQGYDEDGESLTDKQKEAKTDKLWKQTVKIEVEAEKLISKIAAS